MNTINKLILTVIIVTYNSEVYIEKCLFSIYNTIPTNIKYEIIIIDNNSKNKLSIKNNKIKSKILYIQNNKNFGFAKACNQGIRISKGEYLFFLNPDTIVKNEAIENMLSFLQKNQKVGLVGPLLLRPNQDIVPWQMGYQKTIIKSILEIFAEKIVKAFKFKIVLKLASFIDLNYADSYKLREVDWVNGSALMIRKSILEKVNGFDERFFLYYEEIDLQKRLKNLGWKIYHLPESVVIHYGKGSFNGKDFKPELKKSRYLYFQKYYPILSRIIKLS